MRHLPRSTCILALVVAAPVAGVGAEGFLNPGDPIAVSGARTASYYDETGGLRTTTNIPGGSAMKSFGGSHSACEFTAAVAGTTSDHQQYSAGQVVSSTRWVFSEDVQIPNFESPGPTGQFVVGAGPLAAAKRLFAVSCDTTSNFVALLWISAYDPFFDPRPTGRDLISHLQLVPPTIYQNPVVDVWGGLITRYPSWLAIAPGAWQRQRSPVKYLRGWTVYLNTQPLTLAFDVDFVPNPAKPSPAFHESVQCVADGAVDSFAADADSFPALPLLAEQAEPGVNGACTWTPPGPGTVTIQARITNTVTLWVSGYTEAMPNYTWVGPATTFRVGELSVVNTNN